MTLQWHGRGPRSSFPEYVELVLNRLNWDSTLCIGPHIGELLQFTFVCIHISERSVPAVPIHRCTASRMRHHARPGNFHECTHDRQFEQQNLKSIHGSKKTTGTNATHNVVINLCQAPRVLIRIAIFNSPNLMYIKQINSRLNKL